MLIKKKDVLFKIDLICGVGSMQVLNDCKS